MKQFCKIFLLSIVGGCINILYGKLCAETLPIPQQQNFDYYYYDAERALLNGEIDNGTALLEHCLFIQPNNAAANFLMGAIYASIDSVDLALKHYSIAIKNDPAAWQYAENYISLLADKQDYKEIERIVKTYLKFDPTNAEALRIKALSYVQKGAYSQAIRTYNTLERIQGINEMTSIEKFKLHMAMKKNKKAMNEIDRLIEEFPAEYRYQVLRGQLYMGQKMPEKAYESYLYVLEKSPENPYVHIALADYHKQQGEPQKASERILTALQSKHLDVNTKLEIYGQYKASLKNLADKQEELENMLKGLCEDYPFDEAVYIVYGLFLEENKRIDSALLQWKNAVSVNPKNREVWIQILTIYSQKDDYKSIITEAEKAHNALPEESIFLYYKAVAYNMLNNSSLALELCTQAIALCKPEEWRLQAHLWGMKGNILQEMGDLTSTLEAYEIATKILPDDMMLINNYAYFLSMEGKDLKKAERLSQRTINEDPENAVYLDTYAWILHLQGYHSLAKFYIERAVKNCQETENPVTYYEHYGYIMLKNNQEDKAMQAWKKAVELGTKDPHIIETIQNLPHEDNIQ